LNNDTLAGFHLRHFRVTTRALWGDVLVSALSRKVAAIHTEGMVVNILKVTGSAFGLVTTKGRVTAFCVFPKKARNPVVQSQYLLMLEGQCMEKNLRTIEVRVSTTDIELDRHSTSRRRVMIETIVLPSG
jgi:hypothetical protein